MNKLHTAPQVYRDLAEIKTYISKKLKNPGAAVSIVSRITKDIRILKDYSFAGPPLSSIADVNSDYRFLVSGHHMVFYRIYGNDVYLDRILDGRSDYLRILFPNITGYGAVEE